jgi:alanine racemase
LSYTLNHIASIIGSLPTGASAKVDGPSFAEAPADREIEHLLLDSRKVYSPRTALFFALKGPRRDGHQFIPELYKKGVRNFVVGMPIEEIAYPGAAFVVVDDPLAALQTLAAYHRKAFSLPVVGITGSNGKTVVKEWLYQLLHSQFNIVRSPKSYNSQIGVPLSIWQINNQYNLGIFEAGISKPGEMEKLEAIIHPSIGVLTNIGEAHSEGFTGKQQKLEEKMKLFEHSSLIVANGDEEYIAKALKASGKETVLWGRKPTNTVQLLDAQKTGRKTNITLALRSGTVYFSIPFTDDASIENAINCFLVSLQLGMPAETLIAGMQALQPVNMRLELKKGINHCTIINDSYSADLNSLEIALNFLDQQTSAYRKTVILSDFLQSAEEEGRLYNYIVDILRKHQVSRLVGIGEHISNALQQLSTNETDQPVIELYASTEDYIRQFLSSQFKEETVLVKGARVFGFEQIVQLLEQKVHQTVLEINLNAIVNNVKAYQQRLKPSTRIMAMVKAFAYGSGGAEIAGILQYHKIDYLGVAYADEGVELRKSGISLPIMVMNPEETAFESIVEHNLEPDIYSFGMLQAFETFLENEGLQQYPVHIEIETGMNRLGFAVSDTEKLAAHLASSSLVKVQTVFSHLAASEDPAEDEFTRLQFNRFQQAASSLETIGYSFLKHISNTGAIFRLPELQLDMVRLGIGMYGVDSGAVHQSLLQPVATLKTTIAQLKHLKPGETVSYNRRGVITKDSVIATVRIGYADGYSRKLGYGVGKMYVRGHEAPVIGTVCMDMTMIDVTSIPNVQEGDEVIIFGKEIPVQQLAAWAGTIPYEIMTGISQRVKRVYFEE